MASPGLENAVAAEVEALALALALHEVRAVAGGVEFSGDADNVRRLLPRLRVATRVWRRLGVTRARAFGELERKWASLPWRDFVLPGQPLRVEVAVHRCRLYHTGALRQRLLGAAAGVLGQQVPVAAAAAGADDDVDTDGMGDGPSQVLRMLVRGEEDSFTVSVDASGDRLNVRGYRQEIGKAPLRETLAAGMLSLCRWVPEEPLVDPMCGSGTLPIEAAMLALGRLPPRQSFAMDAWPCRLGAQVPSDVLASSSQASLHIFASDRDAAMVERARRNAARAGVAGSITFAAAALEDLTPPAASGLLLFNPPYGHRLGAEQNTWSRLAATLGRAWKGWRAGILVPEGAKLRAPGATEAERHRLRNGGLATELVCLRL